MPRCWPPKWRSGRALLDKLGLFTMEVYAKSRSRSSLGSSRKCWNSPLPCGQHLRRNSGGKLSSARWIVSDASGDGNPCSAHCETGAEIAIIDITGVPTVDTLVAQHLLKTVAAARLMGADCIISGIRPQIAARPLSTGEDRMNVTTAGATLAGAG